MRTNTPAKNYTTIIAAGFCRASLIASELGSALYALLRGLRQNTQLRCVKPIRGRQTSVNNACQRFRLVRGQFEADSPDAVKFVENA
jgi:hypothetical protein